MRCSSEQRTRSIQPVPSMLSFCPHPAPPRPDQHPLPGDHVRRERSKACLYRTPNRGCSMAAARQARDRIRHPAPRGSRVRRSLRFEGRDTPLVLFLLLALEVSRKVFAANLISANLARISLFRSGNADHVAFGIPEVANNQTSSWFGFGAHQTLPSEPLSFFERGLDIGNARVENRMALIARASPDTIGNARAVAGRVAVHKAVIATLGNRLTDGAAGIELPSEKIAVVASQLRWIVSDDFEVHNRLSHR